MRRSLSKHLLDEFQAIGGAFIIRIKTQHFLELRRRFVVHAEHGVGEGEVEPDIYALGSKLHGFLKLFERFVKETCKAVYEAELMVGVARIGVFLQDLFKGS